ncbi:MAG: hypothetical protein KGH63_04375, partial [Candidatus Micrarchaeota archaeon]|nr:hypothetical protein [Candidatus Micrarchaeota archaeon]
MFELLFVIGLVAFIGFASRWMFERTRIPEVVILLAVGFALGPLGVLSSLTFIPLDLQTLRAAAPLFG